MRTVVVISEDSLPESQLLRMGILGPASSVAGDTLLRVP